MVMGDDMDRFLGRWEVTSTENMDEMLKSFDMPEEQRSIYSDMKFVMEYSRDGDAWTYKVTMPNGDIKTYKFNTGVEHDSTTLDGRPIVTKIEAKDGKFVELHRDKADPTLDCEMIREVLGDELTVAAKIKDITSITKHKRI